MVSNVKYVLTIMRFFCCKVYIHSREYTELVSFLFLVIECTVDYCTVAFENTTGHGAVAVY